MNFAVLRVRDFALKALRRAEPALTGKPLAIVTGEGRKAVVAEVSPEANLEPGLTVTLAMARCPGIVLRPRDVSAEVEAGRLLQAAAFTISPRVEATERGCCTIDLRGADRRQTETVLRLRLLELKAAGIPTQAGVADTPLIADYAARQGSPLLVVTDPGEFLRELPLNVAEPTPAQTEILHSWGIRTLGALTALSKADIGQRLGTEGVGLWERAAGETTRVLRLIQPPKSFIADWTYEPPIEMLEPLTFKLQRHAERIALELRAAGLVAETLTLRLRLDDETEHSRGFRLPEPGADVASWMRVMLAHLDTLRLPAHVQHVVLKAQPTRPQQKQDGLFETGLRDPAAFWENLARLEALLGAERVGTPVRGDTHRPDVFILERPAEKVPPPGPSPLHPLRGMALRRFRPPWGVRVRTECERPKSIEGPLEGTVQAIAGPWRADGDWWNPGAWAIESWQVEIDGAAYLLTRTAAGWRVEGVFD